MDLPKKDNAPDGIGTDQRADARGRSRNPVQLTQGMQHKVVKDVRK